MLKLHWIRASLQSILVLGLVMLAVLLQGCAFTGLFRTPGVYWGVYMDGVPWDMNKLVGFEAAVNKKVSLVHWGQPWWHCYTECGYQSFASQIKQYDAVRHHGAIPLIDWASWDYSANEVYTQPQFALRTIIRGDHDAYIREWATEARQWGHPMFLRFDWEMNGNWFPWSEVQNGNHPGEFVQAWRHVHDIFTQVGAKNVTWVWCVTIEYEEGLQPALLYPGPAYVDWVAMDGFNWASLREVPWRSFQELFSPTYASLGALAPGKPIMIAEVGTIENRTSTDPKMNKAAWIDDAFTRALPEVFPNVKAVAWFNWNDGNPAYTWEVNTTTESLKAFRRGISLNYFVENLFANLPNARVVPFYTIPVQ